MSAKVGVLYNVTYPKTRVVCPISCIKGKDGIINAVKNKVHPSTYEKMIRTVDTALKELKPSRSSSLVWASTGSVLGQGSNIPHDSHTHFWDVIGKLFGESRLSKIAAGSFLRWRIADLAMETEDTWLLYQRESDTKDPITGRNIKISEYWIDNTFVPEWARKATETDLSKLANKWGAELR